MDIPDSSTSFSLFEIPCRLEEVKGVPMKYLMICFFISSQVFALDFSAQKLKNKALERILRCPNLNGNWRGKCENVDTREVMNVQVLISHSDCSTIRLNNNPFYPGTTSTETTSSSQGTHTQTTHSYWHDGDNGFALKINNKLHQFNQINHLQETIGEIKMRRTQNSLFFNQLNKVINGRGQESRELLNCSLNL